MQRAVVALPDPFIDRTIQIATQRHFIHQRQARVGHCGRRGDLAGVKLVERVAGGLEGLQRGIQLAEIFRHVLRTQTLAMLTPQQPAITLGQRRDCVGNRPNQRSLRGVLYVQNWPHVQHAGIHMAEHAVLQAVAVQQRTELLNVIGKIFRRHGSVFDKRLRPGFTLDVAEQPHRALAHGVDAIHCRTASRQRVAETQHRRVSLQVRNERMNALLHFTQLIAAEFDQVDAQRRRCRVLGEILGHAMPDDILHGQHQHLGVHGLDGQRLVRHQGLGVP